MQARREVKDEVVPKKLSVILLHLCSKGAWMVVGGGGGGFRAFDRFTSHENVHPSQHAWQMLLRPACMSGTAEAVSSAHRRVI